MARGKRSSGTLEENLKKALTELLLLRVLSERPCYIGELTEIISQRSGGEMSIVFPYAAFYRIYEAGFLEEYKKQTAPDGRLRQYYRITEAGQNYLNSLLETYTRLSEAINRVLEFRKEETT